MYVQSLELPFLESIWGVVRLIILMFIIVIILCMCV